MKHIKLFEAFLNANGELEDFDFGEDRERELPMIRVDINNFRYIKVTVEDVAELPDFSDDGTKIAICFWNNDGSMVDEEIASMMGVYDRKHDFEEFFEVFEEGGEGYLTYDGPKSIPDIKAYFRQLGFNVIDESRLSDIYGEAEV